MSAPAVSIAIRAFRRKWLGGAIESVLAQTWSDFELVIYDDAGDLEDVVAAFSDPRIRYVRAQQKLGPSGRFLAAIALCRGRYIGVLDDDDRYEPQFVERLVRVLENDPRAGAAVARGIRQRDGVRFDRVPSGPAGRQTDRLRRIVDHSFRPIPSVTLLRREALEAALAAQPMPDGVAPDVFLHIGLVVAGWEHVFVDYVLTIVALHDEQITRSADGSDLAVVTYERLRFDDPELERLRLHGLAGRLIMRAAHRLRDGRRRDALGDLRAARELDATARRRTRWLLALAAWTPLRRRAAQIALERWSGGFG